MLAITSFPRRFATASKRPLRTFLARTRMAASVTVFSSFSCPHFSSNRSIHSQLQASTLATALHAEEQDDDYLLLGERTDDWFTTSRNPRSDPTFPGLIMKRLTALKMPTLSSCSRQEMLDYFDNTWAMTDALFATLQGERAFVTPPPHQLRHPLIFYYGHPTSFYVNKLLVAGLLDEPVNPYFEQIFEVGVDEMRWDDMSKNEMSWPRVSDVLAYRRQVYRVVRSVIETHSGLEVNHEPITEQSPFWALLMALEHDRIHQETSSMLMLEHPVKFFKKSSLLAPYHDSLRLDAAPQPIAGRDFPVNEFLDVPAATVEIGKPRDFPSFGWDNEYGARKVTVPACRVSKFLVSNGEFAEFVRDGGYLEPAYWSELGWEWRSFRHTKWPAFWVPDGPAGSHRFKLRLLFDIVPMQWSWPAQVNFHEAQAFCKWRQVQQGDDKLVYHVTTEPIHQLLRDAKDCSVNSTDDALLIPEGLSMAAAFGKNLNWSYLSFSSVDALPPTSRGFYDVFGNAWEWCEDYFAALPGFRVHPYYDDFSEPCFDGEHNVIMGGSFASSGANGASKFSRYHFRPHFFQHAGFRLVEQNVDELGAITLATTDVNAPPPYVNGNPFRSSDRVFVTERARTNPCNDLFAELQLKSEEALEAFIASIGSDKPLVAHGTVAAAKLRRKVQRGEVLVVLSSDEATSVVLEEMFELIETTQVPGFMQESETSARITAETVTAWKKIRD